MKKSKKKGKAPKKAPVKEESSSEEESDDEEDTPAKVPAAVEAQSSEDDSDEEDSSEDEKANAAVKKAEEESDDDDDDDEDDSDEEEEAPKATVKKAEEESDDDDDDDEEDSDEEEEAPKKVKAAAKAKEESEDEDEDEEESDDEDDDDDDEEEEDDDDSDEDDSNEMETKTNLKRKTDTDETGYPTKKAKGGELITIAVYDMPMGLDDGTLNKFFKKHDITIMSCRANFGRGKAFIDIDGDDKGKALALDQTEWKGSTITVSVDKQMPRQPRGESRNNSFNGGGGGFGGGDKEERDGRTLFAKNLPWSSDKEAVGSLFEGVKDVRMLMDRESGRPKGMCFIEFETKEQRDAAYGNKDGYELEGRQLYIDELTGGGGRGGRGGGRDSFGGRGGRGRDSFGRGGRGGRGGARGPSTPSKTLFIKGITDDTSKDSLYAAFQGATDVRMITDRDTGASKGIAYVEFSSEPEATTMYKNAKGGMDVDGTNVYVDYARDRNSDGGGRGGFGGRGRGGFGGRGGGRGGRGGRGRGGGRGGFGGGFAAAKNKGAIQEFQGKKMKFNDDSD